MPKSDKAQEEKWRAESDARTLAEAEVIRGDEARLGKAQEAAKRLAKEEQERADAMARAAKGMEYPKSNMPPKKG